MCRISIWYRLHFFCSGHSQREPGLWNIQQIVSTRSARSVALSIHHKAPEEHTDVNVAILVESVDDEGEHETDVPGVVIS